MGFLTKIWTIIEMVQKALEIIQTLYAKWKKKQHEDRVDDAVDKVKDEGDQRDLESIVNDNPGEPTRDDIDELRRDGLRDGEDGSLVIENQDQYRGRVGDETIK